MPRQPVFRFAPSPNGHLHLGHAYSALLNEALAKRMGGRLLLRVEDIDRARCTPELEQNMLDDLAWLGLTFEPEIMRQSTRFNAYEAALTILRESGLLYAASLSRSAIKKHAQENPNWPRDPDGAPLYPGEERDWPAEKQATLIAGEAPFAWRLNMQKALAMTPTEGAALWGDVVLARKDTPTSYHLAVTLDDAAQGITHVVRGRDLEAATPVHRLLQRLLNLPTPHYFHHRLILDGAGAKLSKSTKSTALRTLRADGEMPDDIRRLICWSEAEVDEIAALLLKEAGE